ncbi:MAG: SIR2 family protein [Desulfobacula sp.]|jgi:NAD-dependent SIR2 family protein deacetylase|nr:SIR2 family protein [Desulfobacula sp.]
MNNQLNLKADILETDFLQHYSENASHLMWFLGAGTSRTAGLPTATDIIWELKHKYYCLHENQDLQSHDINNNAIKKKIQAYMDSKEFPALWSTEEYSFYFDLIFGKDLKSQQKYIQKALSNEKFSLNIGHRVLAALMEMKKARIVFTTNFDSVIEMAFAAVTGKNLSAFHLEGSYAALDALNGEHFPIYAKNHGDFRYQKMMNLTEDLINNDTEIQKCFLAAATRYGLVVSGYSGRDNNVMSMFRKALEQNNAFPQGLFWTVPRISGAEENVWKIIAYAKEKGVRAQMVETGTFDEMLSKIWRQVEGKPQSLRDKVRTAHVKRVSISLPKPGIQFPILRTNALPVILSPTHCGMVEMNSTITFGELKKRIIEKKPNAILTYTDQILFWGDKEEIVKVLPDGKSHKVRPFVFENGVLSVSTSSFLKSFFEEALAKALCHGKPLFLRRKNRTHYIVVPHHAKNNKLFVGLQNVLKFKDKPGYITGNVPRLKDITWAESVSIRLEERDGRLWVMLRPEIWIKPLSKRREAKDFLRQRGLYRYNNQSYHLLDAWIKSLLGEVGTGDKIKISCFPDTEYSAGFEIGTRTAYSRGGDHGN